MLVDSHCHLDFADFDADRAALLMRARETGVKTMVTISTRIKKFPQIVAIAESDPIFGARSVRIRIMRMKSLIRRLMTLLPYRSIPNVLPSARRV